MPLIVMVGKPASGKTVVTQRIHEFMEMKKVNEIEIINDEKFCSFKRSIYRNSKKEREHREVLRSEVHRLLSKDRLIICDSLNYLKSFRYELFCIAKLVQTTYCVVYCDTDSGTCQWFNQQKKEVERYESDDIRDLVMRFEEPDATNRWDSPLFRIKIGTEKKSNEACDGTVCEQSTSEIKEIELPLNDIYSWIFEGKKLSANLSTQTVPLMPSDLLHFLDRITQEVVSSVIEQQRTALPGDTFFIPNCTLEDGKVSFSKQLSTAELSRLRRQFINYMKMHPMKDTTKFASLFVNYIKANT